ncbi:MAG: TA system antitoxin ParD family protein [Nevskiales bacterium]
MTTRASQGTGVLRISNTLIRTAERAGATFHRKAAQQIEYWARLGRSLETMPGVSLQRIEAALTATQEFDTLGAEERAVALMRLGHLEMNREAAPVRPGVKGVRHGRDRHDRLMRLLPDGTREPVGKPQTAKVSRARARKAG